MATIKALHFLYNNFEDITISILKQVNKIINKIKQIPTSIKGKLIRKPTINISKDFTMVSED